MDYGSNDSRNVFFKNTQILVDVAGFFNAVNLSWEIVLQAPGNQLKFPAKLNLKNTIE